MPALFCVLCILAGVPVGGKSSVCLICMKYRIIILIIIIKRLGEKLLSYIANTSRTHSPSGDVVSITALHGRRRCIKPFT